MRKLRVIILGAGFSRPAGLPLANDLWGEIYETAAAFPKNTRASFFADDLKSYIKFRLEADGQEFTPSTVDFEDFMRFLDVEHYFGLRGSDTWSKDGNEGTVVTKYLIGKILARYVNSITQIPDLYLDFAARLQPSDCIITFNYDTILERALDTLKKPYRLISSRSGSRTAEDEIIILKMHGSIDWFDKSHYDLHVENYAKNGLGPPDDIIFTDPDLDLEKIAPGDNDQSPIANMYRVKNLKRLYQKNILFHATPAILPPSATKILYATRLNNFWEGMGRLGIYNCGMAIVGFSLPKHDEYARQILYSIVTNYQRRNWEGEEMWGQKKSPLVIVDRFFNKDAEKNFRDRYRFVDWKRGVLDGDGFRRDCLDIIFAEG